MVKLENKEGSKVESSDKEEFKFSN